MQLVKETLIAVIPAFWKHSLKGRSHSAEQSSVDTAGVSRERRH